MKADHIIKNAKIYTADKKNPQASGALVTWSSDEVFYGDFRNWSPYLAMEIGMTRWIKLTAEHEGFSFNSPTNVFMGGKIVFSR